MSGLIILMLALSPSGDAALWASTVERLELAQSYSCQPRKTCGQIATCEEACFRLLECGDTARDRDRDGIPCEGLCTRPCPR